MRSQLYLAAFVLACGVGGLRADSVSGVLYYTTFSGGQNVWKVSYTYDQAMATFTLGASTNIASTNGADGLLFAPDGNLLVAGQGSNLSEVNPPGGMGAIVKTVDPGNPAFHLALNSSGTLVYSMWNGGSGTTQVIAATPLTSGGLSANGVAYTVSGGVSTDVRGVIFDPNNSTWYYGTAPDGGTGDFGTVVFNDTTHTATLTQLLSGVAAHGLTFDPFTNDIIFSSAGTIDQYDPVTGTIVGTVSGSGNFDQSAVDGQGHLFVASNSGGLEFIDYDATKNIGTATFKAEPFLAGSLDDIAPIAGIGGGGQVPEPTSILLLGTIMMGAGLLFRKRKSA
jgi:hypothetical protein